MNLIDSTACRALIGSFRANGKPVSRATLCAYQRQGMPHIKLVGRVSYNPEAVRQWLMEKGERL